MDRSSGIDLLPEAYAQALRLRDAGREADIAEALDVAPEAVASLLSLAEAKLATLLRSEGRPRTPPESG